MEQRLIRLEFLQKSVNGEELARELISILSVTLGIESSRLLGVMHNRASVNVAAMCIVRVVYPNALDIVCISHTLDLVGDKFKASTLAPILHPMDFPVLTWSQSESPMEVKNGSSNGVLLKDPLVEQMGSAASGPATVWRC